MRLLVSILALLSFSLVLTGCWDRSEIEERAIILGIGIDYLTKEEEESFTESEVTHPEQGFPIDTQRIKLTVQIAVPGRIPLGPSGGSGGTSEEKVWIVEVIGHTVDDAIQNLQQQIAQELYLGHLQLVIISEEVAKSGLADINDFFKRNHEARRTAWMLVHHGRAEEAVHAAPPLEEVPSLYLAETMNNTVEFGKFPKEYMGFFWISSSRSGKEGILPHIKVMSDGNIQINGMAYFIDNRMVGKTTPLQIGTYMSMVAENPGGYTIATELPNDDGVFMYRSQTRKSDIQVEIKDGKPYVHFDVTSKGFIEEENKVEQGIQDDPEYLRSLEEEIAKVAEKSATNLLDQLQEDGSDIFGIGEFVRGKHSKFWDEHIRTKENWQEMFPDIEIEVNYNIEIERTGIRLS
ncbi:Ger(x)C family spore germination protein [Alkalibacillus aidingensis]|uniref:Ger(x)C family spore germination protein n=1 Tax=Alkalibacillus aidingensis TaxID=2747607 RepID=UPI001660F387|nr:Ger(x)C family spore germination protein [Alkalibacillus aidingensis]